MVFEDGQQRRDFVHVGDVARAFLLALEHPAAAGQVFNVGSGGGPHDARGRRALAAAMGRQELEPEITGKARTGDIRHCFADIGARRATCWASSRSDFDAGLAELAEWVARQTAEDRVREARQELESAGAGGMSSGTHAVARPITGGAGFIGSNLADRLASEVTTSWSSTR